MNTSSPASLHPLRSLLLLGALACLGFGSGCKDPAAMQGCGMELETAHLAAPKPDATSDQPTLIIHLKLFNDAPIEMDLLALNWMLEVDGQALSRGRTPQNRKLAKESSHELSLAIPLSETAGRWVTAAMNKPHRQVRLMGFCQLIAAGTAKEVAFDAKQDVF